MSKSKFKIATFGVGGGWRLRRRAYPSVPLYPRSRVFAPCFDSFQLFGRMLARPCVRARAPSRFRRLCPIVLKSHLLALPFTVHSAALTRGL